MIDSNFNPQTEKIPLHPLSYNTFHVISMRASDSGAMDNSQLSLKNTKCIIKNCIPAKNLLFEIFTRICSEGKIPNCLKVDSINFLYKRKGTYNDASNWRPITIAPSIGKIIDKALQYYLNIGPDGNPENHAYIPGRSCLSAVLEVQKAFKANRETADQDKDNEYVTVGIAEDISSAFESIPAEHAARIIRNKFDLTRVKLDEIVLSYFDREAKVVDRKTSEKLNIEKRYRFRSSPQGSVISPKLWRYYDGCFTHLFHMHLKVIQEKLGFLSNYAHVSYADDHVVIIQVKVSKGTSRSDLISKIKTVVSLIREALDSATKRFGCGINRTKSEVILENDLLEPETSPLHIEKSKNEITWLGYSLGIRKRYYRYHLDFTATKLESKIESSRNYVDSVFQYTNNIRIRQKIFKTFIFPVIETFMPAAFLNQEKPNKCLEKFHHWCLCRTLDVSINASKDMVCLALGEKDYTQRKLLVARRLYAVLGTDFAKNYTLARTQRSGFKIYLYKGAPLAKSDYLDRIFHLNELAIASKNELDKKLTFDVKVAQRVKRRINNLIARHAIRTAAAKSRKDQTQPNSA